MATEANLAALADLSGNWIDRYTDAGRRMGLSSTWTVRRARPTASKGSAWNGHFGCTCYHPLFIFNQFGDLERCLLRPGNVHSAERWRSVLEPVVARYRERGLDLYFRGDAAFSNPEIYDLLESEGIGYAIRLPANRVLQERIGHLLRGPSADHPASRRFFASFTYQARSWARPRRVVAKVDGTRVSCTRASVSSSPT